MIKALIIDDEESAANVVSLLLKKHVPEIDSITTAIGSQQGWNAINQIQPDLVFLDIEMPMMSGFELLEKFPDYSFDVIFITAYDHYAIKAIRFSALDYLLKPIDTDELKSAVQRFIARKITAGEKIKSKKDHQSRYSNLLQNFISNLRAKNPDEFKLAISTTEGTLFLPIQEIIRLEAEGSYTTFHLLQRKKLVASRTLKDFADLLDERRFIRIHKSHVVNRRYIKSILNTHQLLMEDNTTVDVSRRKWDEVKNLLKKSA